MDFSHAPFKDRRDAGRQLAAALMHLKDSHPVVLGLPRGGVPVAYEVARALEAPLDVLLVRKIGAPYFPELGLGAVADGAHPQLILNENVVRQVNPPQGYIEEEKQRQLAEIERRRKLYCGDRPPVPLQGRTVLIVDDGIATGGTMKTALAAVAKAGAREVIFAVPVAAREVLDTLCDSANDGICLLVPRDFRAVSPYYAEFDQTSDEEVIARLHDAAQEHNGSAQAEGNDMHASSGIMTLPPSNPATPSDMPRKR
ncbi:phosphoribosyltransferase [Noviherbaspirillum massiliense]|uniref:phosphoribosyltransferase n=1 Tax=Noviherbaspirillum massiliense TaxID=1465823 RepID=UPI0003094BC3|nr:phosphoribosyltransferase [Noviherbaspirillum massiliense]